MTLAVELNGIDYRFALPDGFTADSAFLDGHFAGNPIIPGAVILGYLAAQLATIDLAIAKVARMKFHRLLRPSVPIEITITSAGGKARAEFCGQDGIVASASLTLRRTS